MSAFKKSLTLGLVRLDENLKWFPKGKVAQADTVPAQFARARAWIRQSVSRGCSRRASLCASCDSLHLAWWCRSSRDRPAALSR